MTTDAARRFLARPTGKSDRLDRTAVRELWSLLYRAVRRQSVAVDRALRSVASLARRIGNLSTRVTALEDRVNTLERRYGGRSDDQASHDR